MDTDLGNRSPMSIFNQAVCIKDVKDLTQFIREHMLDDGGSKEKLLALQERFDDGAVRTEGLKPRPASLSNLRRSRKRTTLIWNPWSNVTMRRICTGP